MKFEIKGQSENTLLFELVKSFGGDVVLFAEEEETGIRQAIISIQADGKLYRHTSIKVKGIKTSGSGKIEISRE